MRHVITQIGDKHCILVVNDGYPRFFIFRYAYPTMARAEEVLKNIKENFGLPAGVETDLAANYHKLRYSTMAKNEPLVEFSQRTTQKGSFYVSLRRKS